MGHALGHALVDSCGCRRFIFASPVCVLRVPVERLLLSAQLADSYAGAVLHFCFACGWRVCSCVVLLDFPRARAVGSSNSLFACARGALLHYCFACGSFARVHR